MLQCLLVQHEFELELIMEAANVLEPAADAFQQADVFRIAGPDI